MSAVYYYYRGAKKKRCRFMKKSFAVVGSSSYLGLISRAEFLELHNNNNNNNNNIMCWLFAICTSRSKQPVIKYKKIQ
jgi:hypothetical protein